MKCPNCGTQMVTGCHPANNERPVLKYYYCPEHCILAQQLGNECSYLIRGRKYNGKMTQGQILNEIRRDI